MLKDLCTQIGQIGWISLVVIFSTGKYDPWINEVL
jgi:hypothetical protein